MTLNHKHWHLPHWTPAPLIEMNLLAALNSTPPPQSSPSLSLYHGVFKVTKPLDFDTHHIPSMARAATPPTRCSSRGDRKR
jgi:hypothetical protein